jgi:hypothetical protein
LTADAETGADGNRRTDDSPQKTLCLTQGGAESGADLPETGDFDADLARVVNAWPTLTEATRRAMLALLDTTDAG